MKFKYVTMAMIPIIVVGVGLTSLLLKEDTGNEKSTQPIVDSTETQEDATVSDNEDHSEAPKSTESKFISDYVIEDVDSGNSTQVTVANGTRTITTNALPNHDTGDFPTDGNPNTISAQNITYTLPVVPVFTNSARFAREPGVAINGVKFEPQTAERVECSSGESYSVEAIQDFVSLGLDPQNAHVQPTGAYHYHGVSSSLVDYADNGTDLVHVGFAKDGHLIYYSKSSEYKPSMQLSTKLRTGTGCSLSLGPQSQDTVSIGGTSPDGTYVSDWEYKSGTGDLDECNGTTINGEYAYLVTDDYPYIPRCLNGEFTENSGGGGSQPAPIRR